jgi:hypothetical protein
MKQLVQRLEGIRQILMAHHSAGTLLPNASKGTEREALLREFLVRYFPRQLGLVAVLSLISSDAFPVNWMSLRSFHSSRAFPLPAQRSVFT